MKTILHTLNKRKCINNSKWDTNTLHCTKCKDIIAIRYKFGDDIRIYVFRKFKRYKREIEKREDTHKAAGIGDSYGEIHFEEFDTFLDYLKSSTKELHPISEDTGRVSETGTSEISSRTGKASGID